MLFFPPSNKQVDAGEANILKSLTEGAHTKKVITTQHQRKVTERCTWCPESRGRAVSPIYVGQRQEAETTVSLKE